jgi:hypothetical protein
MFRDINSNRIDTAASNTELGVAGSLGSRSEVRHNYAEII